MSVSRDAPRDTEADLVALVATVVVATQTAQANKGKRLNSRRLATAVVAALKNAGKILEPAPPAVAMVPLPADQESVTVLGRHGLTERELNMLYRNGIFTVPVLELVVLASGGDLGTVLDYCGVAINDRIMTSLRAWQAAERER